MTAVVIPFVAKVRPTPPYVNNDTVDACEQLLRAAETGELSGFAIVGMTSAAHPAGARKFWVDVIGMSAADAERCISPIGSLLDLLHQTSDKGHAS